MKWRKRMKINAWPYVKQQLQITEVIAFQILTNSSFFVSSQVNFLRDGDLV
jgi:hypothetical protein